MDRKRCQTAGFNIFPVLKGGVSRGGPDDSPGSVPHFVPRFLLWGLRDFETWWRIPDAFLIGRSAAGICQPPAIPFDRFPLGKVIVATMTA